MKDKIKSARNFLVMIGATGLAMWGAALFSGSMAKMQGPVVTRNDAEIARKGLETSVTRSYYGINLTLKDKDGDQKVDEKYLSAFGLKSKDLGVTLPYDQQMYDTAFADYGRGK